MTRLRAPLLIFGLLCFVLGLLTCWFSYDHTYDLTPLKSAKIPALKEMKR